MIGAVDKFFSLPADRMHSACESVGSRDRQRLVIDHDRYGSVCIQVVLLGFLGRTESSNCQQASRSARYPNPNGATLA
jgi:hypothetical protein